MEKPGGKHLWKSDILSKEMKHSWFPAFLQEGHDLSKVDENYNSGLPKVTKMIVTNNFTRLEKWLNSFVQS